MDLDSANQARIRFDAIRDAVLGFMEIIETNRLALASDRLQRQVPAGAAAIAFHRWRRSMREHELVRFVALWDTRSRSSGIPNIVRMVRNRKHFAALKGALSQRLLPLVEGDVEASEKLAMDRFRRALAACNRAADTKKSADIRALTRFRHKHVAHREQRSGGATTVAEFLEHSARQPAVDDAVFDRAVAATLEIVADIELAFAPIPTRWQDFQQAFRDSGDALWRSCRFDGRD